MLLRIQTNWNSVEVTIVIIEIILETPLQQLNRDKKEATVLECFEKKLLLKFHNHATKFALNH